MRRPRLSYIIRDHDRKRFEQRKDFLESIAEQMNQKYGEGTVDIEMKTSITTWKGEDRPQHVCHRYRAQGYAGKWCHTRGGAHPWRNRRRAGFSFRGLPCPNIFAGGVNFHGPYEFVSIQVMEKAVKINARFAR